MKIDTVYISKKPEFAILKDKYQWILARKKTRRGEWSDKSYHSVLSGLLDELAETMFKKNSTKLRELKELDKSVKQVYSLIFQTCTDLEKRF